MAAVALGGCGGGTARTASDLDATATRDVSQPADDDGAGGDPSPLDDGSAPTDAAPGDDAADPGIDSEDLGTLPDTPMADDATPPDDATDAPPDDAGPRHLLDDTLRFHHLQALGTHNSYHRRPPFVIPPWDYEHLPLDEQAAEQGVRQFELDLWWSGDHFRVLHVKVIDANTTCDRYTDCLADLKRWSDAQPDHHPITVLLEVKDGYDEEHGADRLAALEAESLSVWPRERVLTPDDVRGDYPTLRDAVDAEGWPTLGAIRGRILLVLHAGGAYRRAYTDGDSTSVGRLFMPDAQGNADLPVAGFHTMNDAFDARIPDVVARGHLVRTRSDSDGDEARAHDFRRADAALASGAHFISTDFPWAPTPARYGVIIPGGTPSACNPLTAPVDCTAESIEDLARPMP